MALNSGLENREYGRGDPLRWPRDTLFPQKLALTSLSNGGRSVGIVRSRTKTIEFSLFLFDGTVVGLARRPLLTRRKIPSTHFCYRLSKPQGHSAVGRIKRIEKFSDHMWNWTHDLVACSVVPQLTALPRTPTQGIWRATILGITLYSRHISWIGFVKLSHKMWRRDRWTPVHELRLVFEIPCLVRLRNYIMKNTRRSNLYV
jgi:hypothetical protein